MMSPDHVSCPAVDNVLADADDQRSAWYAECQSQPLLRNWEHPNVAPVEGGSARVGAAPEGLAFFVELEDRDVFSEATTDQQKMWTLGDVAEFFIKPGTDRSDYWEIHVTPNDFLMDIQISDRERFMAGAIIWDDVIAPSSGTRKRVVVGAEGWSVEAVVPWQAFGLNRAPEVDTVWQFAVCRYNCTGGLQNPELSSTAPFTEAGFHRFEEFADLVF
jgi:hypothetical protein